MILKSSLEDKNKSLLSQIKNDQRLSQVLATNNGFPLGQHVGLDSPLAKWMNCMFLILSYGEFGDKKNQSRQHEILYDSIMYAS